MKKFLTIIFLSFASFVCFGQSSPKKIKVILLGTFHFNQSLDSTSKLKSNLFSEKRQNEIDQIVEKLVKQKPDKIFLEFTEKNQKFYDSIYLDYLNGQEPKVKRTKANEIFQLGMKTAKKLNLKSVIGINYQPEELVEKDYKPVNTVDKKLQDLYVALGDFNDTIRTNSKFYDLPFPKKQPKQNDLLQKMNLIEFILHINQPEIQQLEEYSNWNYYYSLGQDNMNATDYVGTFWYGANVKNYNNVLRQADLNNDKTYLIIYGNSHIPFMKYLFKMNPYFEVLELSDILK